MFYIANGDEALERVFDTTLSENQIKPDSLDLFLTSCSSCVTQKPKEKIPQRRAATNFRPYNCWFMLQLHDAPNVDWYAKQGVAINHKSNHELPLQFSAPSQMSEKERSRENASDKSNERANKLN